jgi:2-oxoglutarate dehydrogenase E1 component
MEEAYIKSKTLSFNKEQWMTEEWAKIKLYEKFDYGNDTGVTIGTFNRIGKDITTLPTEGGKFHNQIVKIFAAREKSIAEGKGIDWGTAEALAFATLLNQDYHIRLSGQDVERGTFSHRHAHVFYQDSDGHYSPINKL